MYYGPKLREREQIQLADELNSLLGMSFKFDFDWSESCIESMTDVSGWKRRKLLGYYIDRQG
ncbi:MAG: hypothetical protein K0S24_2591 [Sphingobacterium sp.]|jgi:hypothetical protein|nr:hypothetical protein [Sphingobacterium sp.]